MLPHNLHPREQRHLHKTVDKLEPVLLRDKSLLSRAIRLVGPATHNEVWNPKVLEPHFLCPAHAR